MSKKQPDTRYQILATMISRLFDPVWLIPVMLAGAVGWSVWNSLRWRFLVLLILIDGLVPFLYFVHLFRTKEISDWDTTNRRERLQLYGFTVIVHAIGVLLSLLLGKMPLAKILFSFWILAAVFFVITTVWKISLHTGVSAAAVTFMTFTLGWQWLWLSGVVFLIAWARVVLRKHTWVQVIVGAVVAPLLLVGMLRWLGVTGTDARAPSQEDVWFQS